jgi:hypothetical protein
MVGRIAVTALTEYTEVEGLTGVLVTVFDITEGAEWRVIGKSAILARPSRMQKEDPGA